MCYQNIEPTLVEDIIIYNQASWTNKYMIGFVAENVQQNLATISHI